MAQSAVLVHAGGNLPAEVTSFVGRRREVADAKRALSKSRLVTLTGVGGVGKTRVAERVAKDRRRAYPHGVWLVELAQLADPALLTQTVLAELSVRGPPSGDALEALIDSLSSRHLLLVLDNCEHLLDEVAALSAALLRSCPDLQILATSRAPLRVVGEAVLPVPPMAAPAPERSGGVAGLSRYDAVALLTERAAAAVPDFALTDDNYRAVAALCHRLDGLPLAIELAAGRLRSLSPAQILSKLDDRYALLTGGERGRPDRQQTLRASIEWSYQLCTPQEQRLWARLCVFAGSFELDAVEAVCTGDIAGDEIVDLVSGLVDKSIVVRHDEGTVARYRLLETIREFGLERLTEAGDGPALRMRHLQWCAALVHTAKAEWISERQMYWLARLAAEGANIRSAVDFCLNERGDADAVMEIVAGTPLGLLWARGNLGSRHWLDEALARSSGVTVLRVRAMLRSSIVAMFGGDVVAGNQLLDEARGLIQQVSDPMVRTQLHFVAAARAALGDQAYAAAFRRGRQMPLAQALNDAEHTRRSTRLAQRDVGGAGLLTSREEEIAGLLAQGLSNKAIAKSLVIAQRTAETHVANVLVKLGLTSRSQVAAWVAEQRGIDPSA